MYIIKFPLRWSLVEEFLMKYVKVMLGQRSVDFSLRKSKFSNFWLLMNLRFSWWIMINPWSNDESNFKMLMLTKNLEVWLYVDHSWLFTQHNRLLTIWAFDWAILHCEAWNLAWRYLRTHRASWSPFEVLESWFSLRNSKP